MSPKIAEHMTWHQSHDAVDGVMVHPFNSDACKYFNIEKPMLFCHNIDVMHIERSVFENIFNTVMEVKGKIKKNIKVRMNITLFCHHKNMELVYIGSHVINPKASFILDKNAQLLVYQWLKNLCFYYRYASNISRLVN
jgi:hypothetical protein